MTNCFREVVYSASGAYPITFLIQDTVLYIQSITITLLSSHHSDIFPFSHAQHSEEAWWNVLRGIFHGHGL